MLSDNGRQWQTMAAHLHFNTNSAAQTISSNQIWCFGGWKISSCLPLNFWCGDNFSYTTINVLWNIITGYEMIVCFKPMQIGKVWYIWLYVYLIMELSEIYIWDTLQPTATPPLSHAVYQLSHIHGFRTTICEKHSIGVTTHDLSKRLGESTLLAENKYSTRLSTLNVKIAPFVLEVIRKSNILVNRHMEI